MKLTIRNDKVEIEGYVNAIERKSKPLTGYNGKFVEEICEGAFKRALERNDDVHVLLNHDWTRDLGSTKTNLELEEDSIGLRARFETDDAEVVKDARNGDLVGWSFGFTDIDCDVREEDGMPLRMVRDLDLYEVSILNRTKSPAYKGTLVSVRNDDGKERFFAEPFFDGRLECFDETSDMQARAEHEEEEQESKDVDYSAYENLIKDMKGE